MSEDFYRAGLAAHGIEAVVPDPSAQADIHRIIFSELIRGVVTESSATRFDEHCRTLAASGADAVLLACTELAMLPRPAGDESPRLDTARIHAEAAWARAVGRAE
jgi:aspartate racemase